MNRLATVAVLAVVLLLPACAALTSAPSPTAAPTATPSPLPTPTATLTLSTKKAILEYAEQCAAILQNTPLSIVAHGTRRDFLNYVIIEWDDLVPPRELAVYHEAVLALYNEWRTLPEGADLDMGSPVAKHALDETFKLDTYTLDTLEETGCVDRNASLP